MPEDEVVQETVVEVPEEVEVPEAIEEAPEEAAVAKEEEPDYRGKLNAQNNFLKKEGYEFKEGKWVKPAAIKPHTEASSEEISSSDSIFLSAALAKGTVHEDDIERVQKFAKMENMSIKDALKDSELKAILDVRAEQRKTAQGANVSNVRRGATVVSDEVLVTNANNGKLPDDEEGINRLIAAKLKQG